MSNWYYNLHTAAVQNRGEKRLSLLATAFNLETTMVLPPDIFQSAVSKLSHPEQTTKFVSELAKKTGLTVANVTAVIADLGLNEVHRLAATHEADAPRAGADAPVQRQLAAVRIGRSIVIV